MKYFEIRDVIKKYPDMTMYIIFGERSNGKTYSCLDLCLEEYAATGAQTAYIRRSREDLKASIVSELFASHIANGRFDKYFGKMELPWNCVRVKGGMVYPQNVWYSDSGRRHSKTADSPMLITAALSTWMHSKGISFPKVRTVFFDEFLTNGLYLPDEVNIFQNLMSSFVRERGDVRIFLIGNTVNKFSPYFSELGLTHVGEMKPGDSQVYTSSDGKAKYLVMLADKAGEKASDKYFSIFGNETSKMITGGAWEMSAYPITPSGFSVKKPNLLFFISFQGHLIRGDVLLTNNLYIVFSPARNSNMYNGLERTDWYRENIVYTDFVSRYEYDWFCLTHRNDKLTKAILSAIREGRVYFANNETGDLLSSYLKWCDSYKVV